MKFKFQKTGADIVHQKRVLDKFSRTCQSEIYNIIIPYSDIKNGVVYKSYSEELDTKKSIIIIIMPNIYFCIQTMCLVETMTCRLKIATM